MYLTATETADWRGDEKLQFETLQLLPNHFLNDNNRYSHILHHGVYGEAQVLSIDGIFI